jgi:RNA polymerase sigma factor (sigma-70 family)
MNSVNGLVNKFSSDILLKEDLFQESYLVYRKCKEKYDGEQDFCAFYGISLRNHFISLYRNNSVRFKELATAIEDEEGNETNIIDIFPSDDYNSEDLLELHEMIRQIKRRLPKRYSDKLMDLYTHYVSPKMISRELHISYKEAKELDLLVKESLLIVLGCDKEIIKKKISYYK